jgi:hypothetical protein
MAYSSLTYTTLQERFGVRQQVIKWLPDDCPPHPDPELERHFDEMSDFPANSEKARSELYVMPMLLACWRPFRERLTLFSGERIDSDPRQGLSGECDFVFCAKPRLMWVEAPVVCVIEAKREDLEVGLRQCAAQLVGLHRFNERYRTPAEPLIGCTTDADRWQFVRLREGVHLDIDPRIRYLSDLPGLLGLWRWVLGQYV